MRNVISDGNTVTINPKQGIKISHRKERYYDGGYQLIVFDEETKEFAMPVDLRLYSTEKVSYACVWLFLPDHSDVANGSGSASGWGYHRASHAAKHAFESAGIKPLIDIDGRGDEAIEGVLTAIAKYYGFRHFTVNRVHA